MLSSVDRAWYLAFISAMIGLLTGFVVAALLIHGP
jgi:hypothetical protein